MLADARRVALTGYGFAPGEAVTGVPQSTATQVGSATADLTGRVDLSLDLPGQLGPGTYGVVLRGLSSGRIGTAAFVHTVGASTADPAVASADSAGLLAWSVLGAVGVVAGVIGAVVGTRRRGW